MVRNESLTELVWSATNKTSEPMLSYDSTGRVYEYQPGERVVLPKQVEAFEAIEQNEATLFGGAVGGGKSVWLRWALIKKLIQWAKEGHYDVRVGLFCETFKALTQRQINPSRRQFPSWLGTFNKSEFTFTLKPEFGGGMIEYCNLDDTKKYLSNEWAMAAFDEITRTTEEVYMDIVGRCRWPGIEHCPIIAATNPGGVGHCVPYGEVLTPSGWKDIRDFSVSDPVMTVTPDGTLVESIVEQVHRSHYSGKMARVNVQGLTMECTPNHRVAKAGGVRRGKNTRDKISDKFSLVEFQELPGQTTILRSVNFDKRVSIDRFFLPLPYRNFKGKHKQPNHLYMHDFTALLGWFLSEGHTNERDKAFTISQMKPNYRKEIKELLDNCGFVYSVDKNGYTIYSRAWYEYFRQFGKSRQKFIPTWAKQLPCHQLYPLFESLVKGDGHIVTKASGQYYTISKRLADDVSEVAFRLGYIVSVNKRRRYNREGESYCINYKRTKSGGTEILTGHHKYNVNTKTKRKSDVSYNDFDGEVFCIGVPDTHSFVIRQNGSIWISGNSWVQRKFVNPKTRIQAEYHDDLKIWSKPYGFIQSLPRDNPLLPKSYWVKLKQLPTKRYNALVLGDWSVFEGQFFHIEEKAHIVTPFRIPHSWLKFRAIDHGWAHPTVCLWGAVDPATGIGYIYREHSFAGKTPTWHKKQIYEAGLKENNGFGYDEQYILTVGDPKMFATDGSVDRNKTPAEIYNLDDDGIGSFFMTEADNSRQPGWDALREMLDFTVEYMDVEGQRKTIITKLPKVRFFNTCSNLVSSLQGLVHDEKNVEDAYKTKGNYGPGEGDDEAETLRYWVMTAMRGEFSPEYGEDPDQYNPMRLLLDREQDPMKGASIWAID